MGFTSRYNCTGDSLGIGRVGALCGNVHFIEDRTWITDNALVLSVKSERVSTRFLADVLTARNLNSTANKTAQPLITGSSVLSQRIPLPPRTEQDAIVELLSKATAHVEARIGKARRQIELVEEYRTRLIADVVTGTLDVREAAAGLPDEADDDLRDADGLV